MASQDVIAKLFKLINTSGGREESVVTFKDGSQVRCVPHGFHMENGHSSMDVVDPKTHFSHRVSLDDVTDIETPGF